NQNIDEVQSQTINASDKLSRYEYKNKPSNIKKYKKSNSYKISRFYSTPEINTYKIKEKTYVDENKKKHVLKNVFGEAIVEDVKVTIGGHKGFINVNENYFSDWVYVDTDNKFIFDNKAFCIDKELEQYKVKEDNQCEMEKVLCYYLVEKKEYRFFDENIEDICKYVNKLI